jgi:hypothetical protein
MKSEIFFAQATRGRNVENILLNYTLYVYTCIICQTICSTTHCMYIPVLSVRLFAQLHMVCIPVLSVRLFA